MPSPTLGTLRQLSRLLVYGALETESFAPSSHDEFAFFEDQTQYGSTLLQCQND